MKGDPEFVILKHTAWMQVELESHILGSIIKNPLSPSSDYVPDNPTQYNQHSLQENTATEFILANNVADANAVSGSITKVANFAVKGRTEDKIHLQGKLIRVKRLQQVSKFWDALRADPTVKSTVPRWMSFWKDWPVCMVVGIMICEDIEHTRNTDMSRDLEATAEVPVGTIAAAAGAPLPVGSAADSKLTAGKSREASTSFQAKYETGQIFAVELRKVTTELFHRKELKLHDNGPDNIDPARLAGAGMDDDEDDDDDKLDEPVDAEDLICVNIDPRDTDDMVR
ncbi:hypothetical protein K4K57_003447 [Colletotrichum sp. SAR 10_99]|nr:hypothetical protein K4K55_004899 [Colletotrichum sp. SAR 10_96]KAJ5020040.1 hypothetical protein K4K57_003447 [Colletotrichum sp. SAR 10_99]